MKLILLVSFTITLVLCNPIGDDVSPPTRDEEQTESRDVNSSFLRRIIRWTFTPPYKVSDDESKSETVDEREVEPSASFHRRVRMDIADTPADPTQPPSTIEESTHQHTKDGHALNCCSEVGEANFMKEFEGQTKAVFRRHNCHDTTMASIDESIDTDLKISDDEMEMEKGAGLKKRQANEGGDYEEEPHRRFDLSERQGADIFSRLREYDSSRDKREGVDTTADTTENAAEEEFPTTVDDEKVAKRHVKQQEEKALADSEHCEHHHSKRQNKVMSGEEADGSFDRDLKITEHLEAQRELASNRNRRSVKGNEKEDKSTEKKINRTEQNITAAASSDRQETKVAKRDANREQNHGTVIDKNVHRLVRDSDLSATDMEVLVEGASAATNSQQEQGIYKRDRRQSGHNLSANHHLHSGQSKPDDLHAIEGQASRDHANTVHLKTRYSRSIPQPYYNFDRPSYHPQSNSYYPSVVQRDVNPIPPTTTRRPSSYCTGRHQIIIHDPVHCPVLTCRDFDEMKFEWLLCVYGPLSRLVVLDGTMVPPQDVAVHNHPSLQCACDMGFVMNEHGDCVRRIECEETKPFN